MIQRKLNHKICIKRRKLYLIIQELKKIKRNAFYRKCSYMHMILKTTENAFQLRINNHRVKIIEKILKKEKRKKSIGGENK